MTAAVANRTDATGTRRRIQAMHHDGYDTARIATALQTATATVHAWLRNSRGIDARHAWAVAELHRAWAGIPAEDNGSSAQAAQAARTLARRRRWKPSIAWDGRDIDDPAAVPVEWRTVRRAADLVEDAEWLRAQTNGTWDAIAAQLNVRKDTLHQYRTRERRRQEASTS